MVPQSALENRLLKRLRAEDYQLLGAHLEPLTFQLRKHFALAGAPVEDVYFLESGVASIVIASPEGQSVEGGIIGREGFVAPPAILGASQSPHVIRAQIEGMAHRIAKPVLLEAMRTSPTLRDVLLRFTHVSSMQASFTLLSNAVHQVDERLARWLLMCHDRLDSDDIQITHEFMSLMLAVRRPSVTNALHILEGNGFIRSERGYVLMLDRKGLEEFAGDAYGKPEAEYRKVLGPFK